MTNGLLRTICQTRSVMFAGAAAAALVLAGMPSTAAGQGVPAIAPVIIEKERREPSKPPNSGNDVKRGKLNAMAIEPITESIVGRLLRASEERELELTVTLRVDGFSRIFPDGSYISEQLKFETAAILFPVPPIMAASSGGLGGGSFTADLQFDGKTIEQVPTVLTDFGLGQQYWKWTATNIEAKTMQLRLKINATVSKLTFDDRLAFSVPWPKGAYPKLAQTAMETQLGVDYIHTLKQPPAEQRKANGAAIDILLAEWTGGEDPKKLGPVHLAKFLAAQMMEMLQQSGSGLAFNRNTSVQGFELKPVWETLREKRGNEFEIAAALAAVYRHVGLPTRVVLGWDRIGDSGGGQRQKYRAWVEFCVVCPISGTDIWVPVDIVRQRKVSSRAPSLESRWDYFGGIVDFQQIVPLSFYFHPPTTVGNAGAPCLWGWLTTPTSQIAQQSLQMAIVTAPKRGSPNKK